jgi:hypothetical protein
MIFLHYGFIEKRVQHTHCTLTVNTLNINFLALRRCWEALSLSNRKEELIQNIPPTYFNQWKCLLSTASVPSRRTTSSFSETVNELFRHSGVIWKDFVLVHDSLFRILFLITNSGAQSLGDLDGDVRFSADDVEWLLWLRSWLGDVVCSGAGVVRCVVKLVLDGSLDASVDCENFRNIASPCPTILLTSDSSTALCDMAITNDAILYTKFWKSEGGKDI